jgi:hypothetical protein
LSSRFANSTKKEVADEIQKWLLEEKLPIFHNEDKDTDISFGTGQGNTFIIIGFLKESKDGVLFVGFIKFGPEEKSMIRYTKIKRRLLYELELLFTQANLDCIIATTYDADQEFTIEEIKLQKFIFFDGLTKDRLFEVLSSIFNCLKVTIAKFWLLGETE